MPSILCLHGFLGSPKDFSFLQDDYDCFIPDLNNYVSLDIHEIYSMLFKEYNLENNTILLGYSFGSRLGAQLFSLYPEKFSRIILLAGHLGLEDKLKDKRYKIELDFLDKIASLKATEFSRYWNGLKLFENDKDQKLHITDRAPDFFRNYGLSKQPSLAPLLLPHKERVSINYGELDFKYSQYAKEKLGEFSVNFIEGVGHRILQHPNIVRKIVRDFI